MRVATKYWLFADITALHFYRPPSEGWGKVIVSVCSHFGGGGYPIQPWTGGGGGSHVSDFWGGVPGFRFFGGVPGLRFLGGGPRSQIFGGGGNPVSVKGKIFDTRFGLIHVQIGKKIFVEGPLPPPPPVKGKIFDTRFDLIHVQTGKNFFVEGPPPPPSKGKNFWHQIWLDTCSDWKKFFVEGPPPSKGKNFWHQIWLDTCSDWEKKIFCQGSPPPSLE